MVLDHKYWTGKKKGEKSNKTHFLLNVVRSFTTVSQADCLFCLFINMAQIIYQLAHRATGLAPFRFRVVGIKLQLD